MGITVDNGGRVQVGYADGCIDACAAAGPNSFSALATIARQVNGPRLFAGYDVAAAPCCAEPEREERRHDERPHMDGARRPRLADHRLQALPQGRRRQQLHVAVDARGQRDVVHRRRSDCGPVLRFSRDQGRPRPQGGISDPVVGRHAGLCLQHPPAEIHPPRVRRAFDFAINFEEMNRQMFFGQYEG